MIQKIWNKMCEFRVDRLWHYIGFRELTSYLKKTGTPIELIIILTTMLAIGKETWDWYHGSYVDFGDLLADLLGIGLGIWN